MASYSIVAFLASTNAASILVASSCAFLVVSFASARAAFLCWMEASFSYDTITTAFAIIWLQVSSAPGSKAVIVPVEASATSSPLLLQPPLTLLLLLFFIRLLRPFEPMPFASLFTNANMKKETSNIISMSLTLFRYVML